MVLPEKRGEEQRQLNRERKKLKTRDEGFVFRREFGEVWG